MSLPEPSSDLAAVAIERLRGTVEVGFARIDGSLALLVQRSDQTDERLDDYENRLEALETRRWPLPSIGTLTGLAGVTVAAVSLLAR
ncbi:hypothetical protein N4G70_17195 [Streptomyces sp. ASQP_92]|uniref:hypothetical protein n=1 Tax=Streptomyces sp. ASQP_92 TaxID=2979116 RepID=UPI0021BEDE4F|nr:hypothetical protein [Streptomyces sp. ASQP_92]MCT9090578.1 hypothetical protein [Streptomyces sp. ASQP_92]